MMQTLRIQRPTPNRRTHRTPWLSLMGTITKTALRRQQLNVSKLFDKILFTGELKLTHPWGINQTSPGWQRQ